MRGQNNLNKVEIEGIQQYKKKKSQKSQKGFQLD